jgi:nucleotide-binding universal stress UspA family protein
VYNRVLLAIDASELAEQILPLMEAPADKFGASMILVRTNPALERAVAAQAGIAAGYVDPTPIIDEKQTEATGYLARVGERLIGRGPTVVWKQPEGPASESIVEHAEVSSADLIALTTHGRGGLGRAVFGSVDDEVLRRATYPVSLVRVMDKEQS